MTPTQAAPSGILNRLNFNSVVALGCVLLGLVIWLLIPTEVKEPPSFFGRPSAGISPRLFPEVIATGMMIIGAFYFVASLKMTELNGFRGLSVSAYVNLCVILFAMIAYVVLLRPLGYVASSMMVATAISIYYGSRNAVGIGITGILAPLAIYFLFTRYLNVSLPPFPWG
ncbi:tripartite tricarboxylate transporter TctB family protein [Paracoccus sp. Ld10]|uniref:tripartite tricarboxylate transporter TctB family protein n=1 Tax=Paracoccus sp. Ld10 TaxID=649158 RepID=UPI0038654114